MMIFGPLVRPVTSTVTLALSRPVAVTLSPSTTITTGRVRVSPAAAIASISMTSPTATFCCLLPLRTTAYTASHSPRYELLVSGTGGLRTTPPGTSGEYAAWRARRDGVSNTEGQDYGIGCRPGKTRSATPFSEPYRLREPFFLIGTCSTTGASSGAPEAVSAPSTGVGATASPDGVPVPGSRPAVPGSTTPVCGTVPAPDGGPAGRLADRRRVRVTTLGFSGSAGGASAGSSSAGSLDGSLLAGAASTGGAWTGGASARGASARGASARGASATSSAAASVDRASPDCSSDTSAASDDASST